MKKRRIVPVVQLPTKNRPSKKSGGFFLLRKIVENFPVQQKLLWPEIPILYRFAGGWCPASLCGRVYSMVLPLTKQEPKQPWSPPPKKNNLATKKTSNNQGLSPFFSLFIFVRCFQRCIQDLSPRSKNASPDSTSIFWVYKGPWVCWRSS